jgi:hypothetical protein
MQEMVKHVRDYDDPMQRQVLIRLLANQMKKSFNQWNKEGVDDQKILDDLRDYSEGTIRLTTDDLSLLEMRPSAPAGAQNRPRQNNNQNNRKNNNGRNNNQNGRKKY